jgi:hypothetical protein
VGRQAKGPRLYLKRGANRPSVWVIRHGMRLHSTGLLEHQRESAEEVLDAYCQAGKFDPAWNEQRATPPDTIYFLTCDEPDFPVKIGITSDVKSRVSTLSVALPFKVVLLASIWGAADQERLFHMRFAEHRLQGEWFRRTPELMDLIRRLKSEAAQAEKLRKEMKELNA